jgi:putative transposase
MFKKFGYNEDKMEKITKNNPKNLTHFLAGIVFVQTLFKDGRKLQKIWADMGYKGKAFAEWVKAQFGCDFEVVNKQAGPGFQILPRRWVVERTFAW